VTGSLKVAADVQFSAGDVQESPVRHQKSPIVSEIDRLLPVHIERQSAFVIA
jgi:hypothetical protein